MNRSHNYFYAKYKPLGIEVLIIEIEHQEDFFSPIIRQVIKDKLSTSVYKSLPMAFVCRVNGTTVADIENRATLLDTKTDKIKIQIESLYPVNLKPIGPIAHEGFALHHFHNI